MQDSVMQRMWNSAHLSGGNAAYVEELYELYLHDPNAVPEEWRTYFEKLPAEAGTSTDVPHAPVRDQFVLLAKNQRRAQPVATSSVSTEHEKKQVEVLRLIQLTARAAIRPRNWIRSVCGSALRLPTCRSPITG